MWSTEAGVVLTILASPRTGRRLAKPRHTASPDTVTTTRSAEAVHQPASRPLLLHLSINDVIEIINAFILGEASFSQIQDLILPEKCRWTVDEKFL